VTSQKETILSECADMIRNNETEKLQLMFKLMDRVPDEGITPMLNDLEAHIRASGIADMVRLKQKELTCGLYYKHVMVVNYASSGVNKLRASLNDDARVIIYDRHMFIVQATGVECFKTFFPCH
jgi:hypothetical protein